MKSHVKDPGNFGYLRNHDIPWIKMIPREFTKDSDAPTTKDMDVKRVISATGTTLAQTMKSEILSVRQHSLAQKKNGLFRSEVVCSSSTPGELQV